jgi:cbb3-type cytochrome oxidase maturation protein
MSIVYVLIPLGLVLVGLGLWAFFWAVGSGQFDDLDSPGWSVLTDDRPAGREPDRDPDRPPVDGRET